MKLPLEEHREKLFVVLAPGLPYARGHEAQIFSIGRAVAEEMGAVSGCWSTASPPRM